MRLGVLDYPRSRVLGSIHASFISEQTPSSETIFSRKMVLDLADYLIGWSCISQYTMRIVTL